MIIQWDLYIATRANVCSIKETAKDNAVNLYKCFYFIISELPEYNSGNTWNFLKIIFSRIPRSILNVKTIKYTCVSNQSKCGIVSIYTWLTLHYFTLKFEDLFDINELSSNIQCRIEENEY